MSQLRILAGLLVFSLVLGCRAQTPPSTSSSSLDRRIEILVRSQYNLPTDVNVQIGARGPSKFPGYQSLPITVSRGSQSQVIDFLISEDSTKLVHLDTMDLTKIPSEQISIAGRPIRGNPNAKVTVINFDDLECPYCARMHQELFPATMEHYKDQVRYIYKDYPLVEIHPWAMHAAVDANCLAAQNGEVYWNYVDYLHTHGDEISGPDRDLKKSYAALDRVAEQEGTLGKLDSAKLNACIAKQDETTVRAERKQGEALNIDGTPALFVNGERVNGGAVPKDQLWAVIDRAIRAEGEVPPPDDDNSPAAGKPAGAAKQSK